MEAPSKLLLKIGDQIKSLAAETDVIFFAKQLNYLKDDFKRLILSEEDYRAALGHLNDRALKNSDFGMNLAIVLTSGTFQNLDLLGLKTRNLVLHFLQQNHMQHLKYKQADVAKFHNSIILLGEFYNRLKLNNNNPVLILGQSLLELLEKELILILDKKEPLTSEFGKVILTQITQNGSLFKVHHEKQFNAVLDLIRRCLIEIRQCSDKTRAFLLMSLDVLYSNFNRSVFQIVQSVYASYLVKEADTESQEVDKSPPVDKRPKVETVDQVAQTEDTSFDVFTVEPAIIPPTDRITLMSPTESTNSSLVQEDPTSPKSDSNESGVLEMSATIHIERAPSTISGFSSEDDDDVMKDRTYINRIRIGYLDNIPTTYDVVPLSSSLRSNEINRKNFHNGTRNSRSTASVKKYLMEENIENLTFDPSYFEQEIQPVSKPNPHCQSFLQFLVSK